MDTETLNAETCRSCFLPLNLRTSSADYPGNMMVTHFTEPAPNSVLLQVSKSSAIRDSQARAGGARLPLRDFTIKQTVSVTTNKMAFMPEF